MKNKITNVVLILLLSFGLASISFAQVGRQTGTIAGTVSDEEGSLLPGAIVTLTGTGVMGSLTYVTGEKGRFRFPSLIPGECEVKVEMPGFKTTIRGGLRVQVGKTIDVHITLSIATIEEQVTVVATVPVVDIETSKISVSYTSEFLANLPMNRDLYGIQNSIPGAVSEDVDYRRTSSILGGTVRSNLYQLDGVPMNDPATFYPMANINTDVYEEIEFGVGSLPAEVGQADSVVVNIVTKSGGNRFTGSASAYYTADTLTENLLVDEQINALGVNPPESFQDYKDGSLSFGGPLIQDKLWFFLNGRRLIWGKVSPETSDIRLANIDHREYPLDEMLQHYDIDHEEWMGFAKLTFQLTKNLRYMGMYHWNNIYEPVYSNRTSNSYSFSTT
ncbi:MAG: TonB-dependent receptor, partial [Candidatus Aminicenantes bacterium]|nr:TonB-dependent receptor [Candidatus Aminicenantes bacterium]